MSIITEETVKTIVDAVVKAVDPERVYVFGSIARGEARDGSDVDLLVIENEAFGAGRSRLNETNRIHKALSDFRVPVDILLYSKDEFDKWKESINHVIGRCEKEGRLIYARH